MKMCRKFKALAGTVYCEGRTRTHGKKEDLKRMHQLVPDKVALEPKWVRTCVASLGWRATFVQEADHGQLGGQREREKGKRASDLTTRTGSQRLKNHFLYV